jgi:purine-binding chemotaxis protein CheW
MNKKSKIKSTLDSLFTGGRIKQDISTTDQTTEPEKVTAPLSKKAVNPSASKKAVASTVAQKSPVIKSETPKPAETAKPAEKPVSGSIEKLKDESKPIEASPLNQQIAVPASKPEVEVIKKSEAPIQAEKTLPVIDKKAVDLKNPVDASPANLPEKAGAEVNSDDEEHLVIFSLGKELYGVTIHSVESIIKIQAITEVPRSASYVLGVTNLRGTVVPVLDLRRRFNLQFTETTPNTRIIIVNAEGSKVGIVVDEVTEVLKVTRNSIQPAPPLSTTVESAFINGIAKISDRLVILLDLEKVLASSSRQYIR